MSTNKLMSLLPDMGVFVLVVELGSFSAVARQLGVTPSAVSRQISRLEQALDVRLLERTTRRQSPTAEGSEAYQRAKTLVECAREVAQLGGARQKASGDVCLSAPKAYARTVLQPLLVEFMQQQPNINLHLRVSDTAYNPLRDDVDIAVRLGQTPIEGLVNKPLHSVHSILCASTQYLQLNSEPQHPADLPNHSCLALGEHEDDNRWQLSTNTETVDVIVNGRYRCNHSEMRLDAVKQGFGIGVFPEFVVAEALKSGEVIQVLPQWRLLSKYQGRVSMQFVQNKFMPARIRLLVDFLQQRLQQGEHAD